MMRRALARRLHINRRGGELYHGCGSAAPEEDVRRIARRKWLAAVAALNKLYNAHRRAQTLSRNRLLAQKLVVAALPLCLQMMTDPRAVRGKQCCSRRACGRAATATLSLLYYIPSFLQISSTNRVLHWWLILALRANPSARGGEGIQRAGKEAGAAPAKRKMRWREEKWQAAYAVFDSSDAW
jgi:hypothetical protein